VVTTQPVPERDRDPLTSARAVAEHVIARLGPEAPDIRIDLLGYFQHDVDEVTYSPSVSDVPSDSVYTQLQADVPGAPSQGFFMPVDAHPCRHLQVVAEAVQRHLEDWGFPPLPACPGHDHGLGVYPVDTQFGEIPCWACPEDLDHHCEAVFAEDVNEG